MDDIDRIKNVNVDSNIEINIDLGVKLLLEVEEVNIPLTSTFIGLKKDEFFIASPPSRFAMVKHKLFPGNHLIVKYLHNGTVYAFPTKIIDLIEKPAPMILFVYPKFFQSQTIRSIRRSDCLIPTRTIINKSERNGTIRDLSEKGCGCYFKPTANPKAKFRVGNPIELLCQFPGIEGEVSLSGVVQNFRKEGGTDVIGIKLDRLDDHSSEIIYDYLVFLEQQ